MNFLAHLYLSFEDEGITIGNFIADSIRGNKYKHLPEKVQKGIVLHRAIDTYTDKHPIVRQSTKRLHENYSHYSGVIVDILYDHFLAKNWSTYSEVPLDIYVQNFYEIINKHFDILPESTQYMMPYMLKGNWLLNYSKIDGIQGVLDGMNRRTKYVSGMNKATVELKKYYKEFEAEFTAFFEELIEFSHLKRLEITNKLSNQT